MGLLGQQSGVVGSALIDLSKTALPGSGNYIFQTIVVIQPLLTTWPIITDVVVKAPSALGRPQDVTIAVVSAAAVGTAISQFILRASTVSPFFQVNRPQSVALPMASGPSVYAYCLV